MQGVVSKVDSREFPNGMAYSFQLKNDRTFYRLGSKKPWFKEGDSIKFDVEMKNGNSYARTVTKWEGGEVQTPVVPARAVGGSSDKDTYWKDREQRDIATQKRIELQSCRNSAIELTSLLLKAGAVKLPAAQNKQADVIFEIVNKYTEEYLRQNEKGLKPETDAGDPSIDAVEPATDNNNNNEDWT